MDIQIKHGRLVDQTGDLVVIYQFKEKDSLSGSASELNKALGGVLVDLIKREGFEAKLGEWISFPLFSKLSQLKVKRVAVMGLGEKKVFTLDSARKIGGYLIKRARDAKAKNICTVLPGTGVGNVMGRDLVEAFVEGLYLSAYRFHAYKGKMAEKAEKNEVEKIFVMEEDRGRIAGLEKGLEFARALAEATILARNLVNTPSAEMTPIQLAEVAKQVAKGGKGISIKLFDQASMEKMGMYAALAVARGSINPPMGVHLTYKPTSTRRTRSGSTKKIVLVGKAVTFDSGGLSLKPADGMMTMKIDMAGAAAVIGAFQTLPFIQPNVEVHGVFLGVENMPSGSAYRPGDVVKAMNGTTIEILNTDAEGRVTLADALSYAQKIKPDVIIDLATLTGACVVALGEDIAGYMTNQPKLGQKIAEAAKLAGEDVWELPLHQPYVEMIRSKIADMKNIGGSRSAGAITAALLLSHFVDNIPWVHMDIAGPSYAEKEVRPDQPAGGTGYGVRTLARYLQGLG